MAVGNRQAQRARPPRRSLRSPARVASAALPWLGIAGMLGGVLHAVKGAVLVAGGPDLSLVPAMSLFFSIGLLGLYARLEGAPTALRTAGLLATALAIFSAAGALIYQAKGVEAEGSVQIAYGATTFGILVGLLLLGFAVWRADMLPKPWSALPLVVGIIWFPLEGLTAVLPDGWGLLAAGLAWIPVGYTVWPGPGRPAPRAAV